MEAGIIGLPNVGKSTLFNALTAAGVDSANYPFCTIEPNVGVVPVPDTRLARINEHIETEKIVPAILRLVDIAGLVKGASAGEGLGNQFLSHIRQVDAVVHVVRCFADDDVAHVDGKIDPIRDLETIDTELMLGDMAVIEPALDKAKRAGTSGDKEAAARAKLLERCQEELNAGRPLRQLLSTLEDAEAKMLRGFGLITAKRVLYLANVDEDDLHGEGEVVQRLRERAEQEAGYVVPVCAKLEAELAELDQPDREEMLADVGLDEPALNKMAQAAYRLLGLESFFTAGPKEIKAWTVPIGSTAPEAAGVIHSDFQRGFIRAETYQVDDLEQHKTEKAIREAGRMRVEGKDYIVREGDICHFLFNA